jgi:hypothetical protein
MAWIVLPLSRFGHGTEYTPRCHVDRRPPPSPRGEALKRLSGFVLVPAVVAASLALAASAAGTAAPGTKVVKPDAPVVALAIDGSRVAYGIADNRSFLKGKPVGHFAQVLVWNVHTGTTTKVNKRIAMSDVLHIADVAIAGTRVAWLSNAFGNTEADEYVFTSSALKQTQKHVATAGLR